MAWSAAVGLSYAAAVALVELGGQSTLDAVPAPDVGAAGVALLAWFASSASFVRSECGCWAGHCGTVVLE